MILCVSLNHIKRFLSLCSQKVEFCQVNRPTQKRCEVHQFRQYRTRDSTSIALTSNGNDPSQQVASHFPENVGSFQTSDQFLQSRSFRSKMRNMFSWFRKRRNQSEHRDDEDDVQALNEENAEFYYFDHGSPCFYQTTDCPPHLISEIIAQRTTDLATKFWAEFFASLNIGVTFVVTFFMQFYR